MSASIFKQKLVRELAIVLVIKLALVFAIKTVFFSAPVEVSTFSFSERLRLHTAPPSNESPQ